MDAPDLYPGRVFRQRKGNRHMYVIIGTFPCERLLGNWSSAAEGKDFTCLLVPADHPTIHHDSVMMYKFVSPVPIQTLRGLIASRELIPVDDVKEDVLRKIQRGFFESPDTRRLWKKRYAHLKRELDSSKDSPE